MELVTEFDLLGTHAGNNCTVEEWHVVENFLIKGYCSTKEEALICYNNVLKMNFGTDIDIIPFFFTVQKQSPQLNLLLPLLGFFNLSYISSNYRHSRKNNDEKASKRIEEIKKR